MIEPTGTHNDGGLVFGSQLVTIPFGGTGAPQFTAKNIKFNRPTKLIESFDIYGLPLKEALIRGNIQGTMTLEIVDDTTKCPANFSHFKLLPHGGVSPADLISFKISDNGEGWDQNAEGTFEITFRGYLHPPSSQ